MDHNYLYALIHGELASKKKPDEKNEDEKNQLEIEVDKEIDTYVDNFVFNETPEQKALQNLKLRRESLRQELKEGVKLSEFSEMVEKAIDILSDEQTNQLSKEGNEQLSAALSRASSNLATIKSIEIGNATLQSITEISQDTMSLIAQAALAKFAQQMFGDSEALFSFLSILNPEYSEYWLRLGISAQKNENLDLASRAYTAASALDPDNIGARLFGADCLMERHLLEESKIELEAAKNIADNNAIDPMWRELITEIENNLKVRQPSDM